MGVFLFRPKLAGQQDVSWETSEGNLSCARSFQSSKAETVMFVGVFVCFSPSNTLNGYSIANPHDYSSSQSSKSYFQMTFYMNQQAKELNVENKLGNWRQTSLFACYWDAVSLELCENTHSLTIPYSLDVWGVGLSDLVSVYMLERYAGKCSINEHCDSLCCNWLHVAFIKRLKISLQE